MGLCARAVKGRLTSRGERFEICNATNARPADAIFTNTPRGKPPGMKALALMLYAMGNMSFCGIARGLGVSDVAVLKWVRNQARRLPEPEITGETVIITLDEMWHFLKKRLASCGFGARLTLSLAAPSPGCLVAVMMPPRPSPRIKSVG